MEQIRLHQIRAIYGPVANWDQRLEMYDRPHGPLANELLLSSDHLIVDQLTSPGGQRPHVELTALGNVATEVASANGDEFNARSHTLTYDQSKDLITLRGATLEGGGRIDATVWRNNSPRPIEAGEIEFNPLAGGQIRIIDGSHLELNQLGALQ